MRCGAWPDRIIIAHDIQSLQPAPVSLALTLPSVPCKVGMTY
jgi:hypothetical protein